MFGGCMCRRKDVWMVQQLRLLKCHSLQQGIQKVFIILLMRIYIYIYIYIYFSSMLHLNTSFWNIELELSLKVFKAVVH